MKKKLTYFLLSFCLLCPFLFAMKPTQIVHAEEATSKVHFLTLPFSNLAVLVESNGKFGMIDSGEDSDYPDGSNPRYPFRDGIQTAKGHEEKVVAYLKSVGVTQENFEFYIGTHAHSDHIGAANRIIREFHPKRVYTPEYKDIYTSDSSSLWDNLYIYDNMLTAAKEVGASIILNFDENAPVYPELIDINGNGFVSPTAQDSLEDPETHTVTLTNTLTQETVSTEITPDSYGSYQYSFTGFPKFTSDRVEIPYTVDCDGTLLQPTIQPYVPGEKGASPSGETPFGGKEGLYEHISEEQSTVGSPYFTFGDLKISIMNTNPDYKTQFKPNANYNSLGVLVESSTQRAFIPGDINYYDGDEDVLASQIGHVDLYCISHHGYYGSNSRNLVTTLSPDIMVLPNTFYCMQSSDVFMEQHQRGCPIYSTAQYGPYVDALVFDLEDIDNNNVPKGVSFIGIVNSTPETYLYYKDGMPYVCTGTVNLGSKNVHFNNNYYGYTSDEWLYENGGWRFHTKEDHYLKNEWHWEDGSYYYFDSTTYMSLGWRYVNQNWYYFNDSGRMMTGWVSIGDDRYYFYNDGHMASNETTPDGNYVDKTGKWIPGTWKHNSYGYWYRDGDGSYPKNILRTIDGNTYYFDSYGYIVYDWNYLDGNWYYFNSSGHMMTGWQYLENSWYYFDQKGRMQTGWTWIGNDCYYFYENGTLATNTTIGGNYINSSGKWIKDQWLSSGEYWWYRHGDGSCTKDGWELIDGYWYHFDANGWMQTGWLWIDGYCYYLHDSGYLASDETIDGHYVNSSGYWVPDRWYNSGNKWYYRHGDGSCTKFGWEYIDGAWYFFDMNGWMETGWLQLGNNHYYLNSNGVMATGWKWIGDNCYYFYSDGHMATDETIDGNYVDSDGIWIP